MRTLKISLLIVLLPITISSQDFWEQTNGPYGGQVRAILQDTTDEIMIGTEKGVYRSTNNGESWIKHGINTIAISGMIRLVNGNLLAIAPLSGVYRSTNNGDTWAASNSGITDIRLHSITTNSEGHIFVGSYHQKVFRSTDDGVSWSTIYTGSGCCTITALVVDTIGNIYIGTGGSGVLRSTNNGIDWYPLDVGIGFSCYIEALVLDSLGNIYLGEGYLGVRKSTDNGESWYALNSGLTDKKIREMTLGHSGSILAGTFLGKIFKLDYGDTTWISCDAGLRAMEILSISARRNGTLFAGCDGGGVFKSIDNGTNWVQSNYGMPIPTILTLTSSMDNKIYTGTYGNYLFRSTDFGNLWHQLNIGMGVSAYVFVLARTNEGTLLIDTDVLAFRSTNDGETWNAMGSGFGKFFCFIQINNGDVLAGTDNGRGVFRTTDQGLSWMSSYTGLPQSNALTLVTCNNANVFVGTQDYSVYRSTNYGSTWFPSSQGLNNLRVNVLAVDQQNNIYAGTANGVFFSSDYGDFWIQTSLNNLSITALITVSPGRVFAGTNSGVYESTNFGVNWTLLNDGLMNINIKSFTLDSLGTLYAGTDEGVYKSRYSIIPVELNSFTSVQNYSNIILSWITATEINNSGFEIIRKAQNDNEWNIIGFVPGFGTTTEPKSYSFTDEDVTTGIYKYHLKQIDYNGTFTYSSELEVEVDFTPKEFVLYQNYPNPFNPSTVIKYEIPSVTLRQAQSDIMVKLIVYDVLGSEVAILVNEEKQPGVYEIEFNKSSINHHPSSGIYFYQLKAGSFLETKRMVFLK